ncbi:hypothetical protein U4I65_08515 [Stenotrophomonas maltophilia]|uniref:hypothetical protein n=1 Tax=Stenotrophomonas maltophilia TaxID=40324 RepID=UPI002ACC90E4|nr:hypothetical protein [Stenotrophomonas maltophilia]MDZ5815074.1 hypothetical protein [Stenotrophomonas maltophilia]
MSHLPIERAFPTGSQGATLVLMVCADWLWAGLYASPYSAVPAEVSAAARLGVTVRGRRLQVGQGTFPITPKSLQAACRWLDRNGVHIRTVSNQVKS